jgi:hypothetical protein
MVEGVPLGIVRGGGAAPSPAAAAEGGGGGGGGGEAVGVGETASGDGGAGGTVDVLLSGCSLPSGHSPYCAEGSGGDDCMRRRLRRSAASQLS